MKPLSPTPRQLAEKAVIAKAMAFVRGWESQPEHNWMALDHEYSALAIACKRLMKARKK